MDRFQAMAVLGLDGPDSTSSKAEIEQEIARLEAFESYPQIKAKIAELRLMFLTATDEGGFRHKPSSHSADVLSQDRYATLAPLFREFLAGQDPNTQPLNDTVMAVLTSLKNNYGMTREKIERLMPYLKLYLQDVRAGNLTNPAEDGGVAGANNDLEPGGGNQRPDDGVCPQGVLPSGGGSVTNSPKPPKPSQTGGLSPEMQKNLSMLSDADWVAAGKRAKANRERFALANAKPTTDWLQ